MASQGVPANSKLMQVQMKFQQKLLLDREHKRTERTSDGVEASETSVPSKHFGNGKVRQMFHDRRRGAGIDRSNPLKPILSAAPTPVANSTKLVRSKNNNGPAAQRRLAPPLPNGEMNRRSSIGRNEKLNKTLSGNKRSVEAFIKNASEMQPGVGVCEPNCIPQQDRFSKTFSSLSLKERMAPLNEMGDRGNNTNIKDFSRIQSSNNIKLKPFVARKSSLASNARALNLSALSQSGVRTQASKSNAIPSAARKTQAATVKTSQRIFIEKKTANKMGDRAMTTSAPSVGMATCSICHRNFNGDRLAKHEEVCQKLANSKRKIFDASKARIKGTEAEQYLKKPINRGATNARASTTHTRSVAASGITLNSGVKKNNWRKKHEEFIASIRAAKQVQAHLAKGGKLSELPPPPPSENPDYVQCPHCLRRFNEAAAERHIPKCATMLHNKPRPAANNRRF